MNLKNWQTRHRFTNEQAAAAIGFNKRTYARYLKKDTLPRWLALACMAIDAGLDKEMECSKKI